LHRILPVHRVVAVAIAEVSLFDLAVPAEAFGRRVEGDRYAFRTALDPKSRQVIGA
jgi:hypothetical protein